MTTETEEERRQVSQALWDTQRAALNLSGCCEVLSRRDQNVKGFRPTDEYMAEALGCAETQLADALRFVREVRASYEH